MVSGLWEEGPSCTSGTLIRFGLGPASEEPKVPASIGEGEEPAVKASMLLLWPLLASVHFRLLLCKLGL